MTLTPDRFPAFYRAVNGYDPLPWQTRLVEEVAAHGGLWPAVLDLPTSAGKTSALDAAVFLLAMQAGKSVHERTAAIRTFFVVDRRIVVDEAAEKARKLARLLNTAEDKSEEPDPLSPADRALVKTVASRLRQYGGDKALHVSVLRGGMYRDGSWAESPTQPTICLSTVDQVGSRLLFRGYGVSPRQRALHAGLVGNDALILVDEAHLSRPFIETLKAIEFYRSDRWAEQPVKTPFQVVVMSATAGPATEPIGAVGEAVDQQRPKPLQLLAETDTSPEVCPDLHRRLTTKKLVTLVETTGSEFVGTVVETALALTRSEKGFKPVQVVGVVVNRVRTARQVAESLYRKTNPLGEGESDRECPDVVLLTGRIRPYDRDELLFRRAIRDSRDPGTPVCGLLPFVKATVNKERTDYDRPPPPRGVLFIVATQTVEVGADFSFDALATELAPLDALRQRLGRVDRLGFRGRSRVVIVRNKEAEKDDPVYGSAPTATWKVLKAWEKDAKRRKEDIDFGIQATEGRIPRDPENREDFLAPLCAPCSRAPVMLPAHLDDWVQTSVAPEPDPDPALFLHGPNSGPADVLVVWRADVMQQSLEKEVGKKDAPKARHLVALVPPTSMEALPLPIWQVQSWLRNRTAADDFTDLEGEPEPDAQRRGDDRRSDPFLIWKGPDRKAGTRVSHNPADIRPGNTIVVPSSYGGCDEFGWNPEHTLPVADVADDCSWRAKRRASLRIHPGSGVHLQTLGIWQQLPDQFPGELVERLTALLVNDPETGEIDWDAVVEMFRGAPGKFEWLQKARRIDYRDGSGIVLVATKRPIHPDDRNITEVEEEAPGDDEGNSFLGTDELVSLQDHCLRVQARVNDFARSLKLNDSLREIESRTALFHDVGKADARFQMWLYGNEANAAGNSFQLIAKSQVEERNMAAVEASRIRARWPKGGRHEAASVLLVRANPEVSGGLCDTELFEYVLGTHHGWGRPAWPFIEDDVVYDPPGTVTVAFETFQLTGELQARPEIALAALHAGWVDLFWRLVRRYGYWGLAYLETLLVLADHRQSEAERNGRREVP
jgi:CRISPR-associated endonuclease/helicase Cas3